MVTGVRMSEHSFNVHTLKPLDVLSNVFFTPPSVIEQVVNDLLEREECI